jgi:hypothetical protein
LGIISILNNVYGNGGYKLSFTGMLPHSPIRLKIVTLDASAGTQQEAAATLKQAISSQWVAQQHTRAVFFDFGLFVPSVNYFFIASFLVECFSTVCDMCCVTCAASAGSHA